jgi:hypothetical protein
VVAVYADGSIIEMATIGREGCSGLQAILDAKRSSVQLLVQIPGGAAKMSRTAFTRAVHSIPSFRNVMDAYVQAFLEQVMVSVACNGAHSLKQRLARWLLMMRDRGDDDVLPITQDLLAEMLGRSIPCRYLLDSEVEMARGAAVKIILTDSERSELEMRVRRRRIARADAVRAEIVLLAADGIARSRMNSTFPG